ncbi:hypothetical protein CEA64_21850 [Salmonella enterica subsp. enterica serovar Cerro]|nr:hypothetical protein [Salmonella enterica subsp. enterica serovar Cerro]
MATLKDHQQAMVDLLASGSGIPDSASRLAHAMHDVREMLNLQPGDAASRVATYNQMQELFARTDSLDAPWLKHQDATTPGLNDKALAADVEACRPKDTMFDRARAAERRVKELENTVKQLRASNAKLREERDDMTVSYQAVMTELRQIKCDHDFTYRSGVSAGHCLKCGISREPEQAGCRKPDTQICVQVSDHDFAVDTGFCVYCGKHYREVTK